MSRKLKKLLIRIGIASILFLIAMVFPFIVEIPTYVKFVLFITSYLIVGYDIILKAVRNIGHGQIFDENFLMTLATFGAFAISEMSEGVMVMLLYQVGEWFQQYAVGKSRNSITELMNIRPDYANVIRGNIVETIDPEDVAIGEIIQIKAGEKIPLDGVVVKGSSYLDTSALTGESVPRKIAVGDDILSGCINTSGVLEVKVTKEFDESTVAKILELIEDASSRKAKAENFITKFAKYYTPIVVIGALALAFLPSIFGSDIALAEWIRRACTFLVISCPCALVISVPLGFFGGIGGAAKEGILIKGSNYMETLAKLDTLVFDKTGTLTKGIFKVTKVSGKGVSKEELLEMAALVESFSNHPIAISLRDAWQGELDKSRVSDVNEISGRGITAIVDRHKISAGNHKLMEDIGVEYPEVLDMGTVIYVAKDGIYAGYIVISDEIKEDVPAMVKVLKEGKIGNTVMLTGDRKAIAEKVAKKIGIDKVYAELLPTDKVAKVEELLVVKKAGTTLGFVGDGINDAPVLTRADVGIAMGGIGSDAAIEAADVIIMDDKPSKIPQAIGISKKTIGIVKQNIVFALGIKLLFLAFGAMGMASLWEAVFADVGVAFLAILNSMRALKVK